MDTAVQKRPIDEVIAGYPPSREHLISILQEVQAEYGYLSRDSINRISDYLKLPSSKIFGVATFYNQFKLNAPGQDPDRDLQGNRLPREGLAQPAGRAHHSSWASRSGETTKDGLFSLETVACLGCCSIAPAMMVNGRFFGRLDKKKRRGRSSTGSAPRGGWRQNEQGIHRHGDLRPRHRRGRSEDGGREMGRRAERRRVQITATGCIGYCKAEPIMDVVTGLGPQGLLRQRDPRGGRLHPRRGLRAQEPTSSTASWGSSRTARRRCPASP